MSKTYSVAEARDRLPSVLHEVEAAGPVEITRHGRPVAVVLSIADYHRLSGARPDLWPAYLAWRARCTLSDADVDALADPSRDRPPSGGIDW
jgi:prevent-host-death family protein